MIPEKRKALLKISWDSQAKNKSSQEKYLHKFNESMQAILQSNDTTPNFFNNKRYKNEIAEDLKKAREMITSSQLFNNKNEFQLPKDRSSENLGSLIKKCLIVVTVKEI